MFCYIRKLLVSLAFFGLASFAYGQDAQIQGQVSDTGGAVIATALVRVVEQQTGKERTTATNAAGQYIAPGLTPGLYKIIVEAPGFSSAVSNVITLNVAQNAVLDFKLQVGTTASEVVVNADNLGINTTDGSVSTVIDRQFVENLPLNGRSFQSLIFLSPGVTPNVSSANTPFSQGGFAVNGQRGDASYWMVDGVSANFGISPYEPGAGIGGAVVATSALGGTSALVSMDALQEFRIATSTYAPEFGRSPGAQISIQTRSGTNHFHGALFEYLRNGDLDATDWFADHYGLAKPLEIQNDFGGVFGGPIRKDKTFFFFSAEGLRLRLPATFQGDVPDMASRTAAILAMQPYLNMYPLPQPGAAEAGAGYVVYNTTFTNPGRADAFSLRLDHQLLSQLNLFARYSHAPSQAETRGTCGCPANSIYANTSVTKTATAGGTWTASPQMVNDLRFNYSVAGGTNAYHSDNLGGGTPFPGDNPFEPGLGLTYQNANLLFLPVFGTNLDVYQGNIGEAFQRQYNLVDTLAVQRGSHSLKFGVDYRRLSPFSDGSREQLVPLFDTMQNMIQGKSYFTETAYNAPQHPLLHDLALFGQDAWRVSPRLTLTYGLRWDIDFAPTSQSGLGFAAPITGFSTTNLSNLAFAPAGTQLYGTRYGSIAPRIGGAYRISADAEWGTVLRGGFGLFYGLADTEVFNLNFWQALYPVGTLDTYSSYDSPSTGPLDYVPFPLPPSVAALPVLEPPSIQNAQTFFGIDPHLRVPYALEWNVSLEQSVGKAQTLSLSYVGASDRQLVSSNYVQNPNPNFVAAFLVGNAGSSSYQALQAVLQRRLTEGLQALVSYTWSHSIDTGSYGEYAHIGLGNANANRGDSDFDLRNTFSAAVTYVTPAWKDNLFSRAATKGWSLDDIVQVYSGPPVDIQDTNINLRFGLPKYRPDVVPGQPFYLTGSQFPTGKAIDVAAFTDPPLDPATGVPTRQGTLNRNVLRSPGLTQWDFALHREFPIAEELKLQFRAELFNVLNHPNFGPYNNQFLTGNGTFGQATQMLNQYTTGQFTGTQGSIYAQGGPRSIQLALRLAF
jgi:Carboxypeptidase regulatory-like domain